MFKLFGLVALAASLLLFVAERPAAVSAHAEYDHSDPAKDATVTSAPSQVKVWFSEGVRSRGSSLKVTNASGQQVDNNDSKVDTSDPDRKLMTVSLQPNLPPGTYKVNWKTVSADDGDEDSGDFSFTVRAAATATPAPTAPAPAAIAPPPAPAVPVVAPAAAAPAPAAPAAQPAAAAAPAQAPRALPRSGEGQFGTSSLLGLALFLIVVGLLTRRLLRAS